MKASTLRSAAPALAGLALALLLSLDYAANRGERISYQGLPLDRRPEHVHRFPVADPGAVHVVSARTPRGESMLELVVRGPEGRVLRSVRDALPRERREVEFTPVRRGTHELLVRDRTPPPVGPGRRAALSVAQRDESVLSRLTGRASW